MAASIPHSSLEPGPVRLTRSNVRRVVSNPPKAERASAPDSFARGAGAPAFVPVVPQVDLGAIRDTTAQSITSLRDTVRALDVQIHGLEARHAEQTARVGQLIASIEARRRDLEAQRDRKRTIGIFGALMGVPAVTAVSFVQMCQDDARLQTLDRELGQARAQAAQLAGQRDAHASRKRVLGGQLARLETAERKLSEGIEVEPKPLGGNLVAIAASAARLQQSERLVENLRAQVELLRTVRDEAEALAARFDGLIDVLEQRLQDAERAVTASQNDVYTLLRIATADDPGARAEAWLSNQVAGRTRALLRELGLDPQAHVARFVDHLLQGALPHASDEVRRHLRGELIAALNRA